MPRRRRADPIEVPKIESERLNYLLFTRLSASFTDNGDRSFLFADTNFLTARGAVLLYSRSAHPIALRIKKSSSEAHFLQ